MACGGGHIHLPEGQRRIGKVVASAEVPDPPLKGLEAAPGGGSPAAETGAEQA